MKILAVDTTALAASIALLDGEELKGSVGFATHQRHAEKLLPVLKNFLDEIDCPLSDIEGYAVAVGPGSFTGLRIGIATVEGLAFATHRPVVGVSALEATAYRYRSRQGLIGAFLDARRGEIYGALYRAEGTCLTTVIEPTCEDPRIFLKRVPVEPVLLAGSGLAVYADSVRTRLGDRVSLADDSFLLAEEVARIGERLHREGKAAPLGGLQAVYLRPSDAEKGRQHKAG